MSLYQNNLTVLAVLGFAHLHQIYSNNHFQLDKLALNLIEKDHISFNIYCCLKP